MPPDIESWVDSVMESIDVKGRYFYPYGALLVHFGATYTPLKNGEQYVYENWIVQFFYYGKGTKVNFKWDNYREEERLLRHIMFFNTDEE